ncbi:YHS domain-containing (seleno)protein [Chryseolinea sp. T2]|uniref:YHS domain-containing (seleno)protein n=1 Tax=Chryseolinea sp. T2 TaxID=3129255 RepID=UPI00307856E5
MKRILPLIFLLMCETSYSQSKSQTAQWNVDPKSHLALSGYDPVAYFKDAKAVKGQASIAAEYEGVRYQFASAAHKELFQKSPALFEPQYGGWCAYAMGAKGEKVEIDPETFKILDGKLYLFYNRFFNNTLDTWNKNEAELKANADKNWVKLTNQ